VLYRRGRNRVAMTENADVKKMEKLGAGEGVRTLDFHLGNANWCICYNLLGLNNPYFPKNWTLSKLTPSYAVLLGSVAIGSQWQNLFGVHLNPIGERNASEDNQAGFRRQPSRLSCLPHRL